MPSWLQTLSSGFTDSPLGSLTICFWSLHLVHVTICSLNKLLLSKAPKSHHFIGSRPCPDRAPDLEGKEKIINNSETM